MNETKKLKLKRKKCGVACATVKKSFTFYFYLVVFHFSFFILTSCPLSYAEEAQASPSPDAHLTLELQGVNILDVFKILSKKSGLNIVAGKNVQGQVSMFLQNVPVKEALKTILQSQGLASVEEGGIIKVMTEEEYLAKYGRPYEDKRISKSFHLRYTSVELLAGKLAELKSPFGKILTEPRTNTLLITEIPEVLQEMQALIEESDQPQETEVFHLKYTRVEELEPQLKSFLEGGAGKLETDKRSNRILVTDIPTRIERVRSLVDAFDVQVPQVLIEAKIVEVRLGDNYRQGINWQYVTEELGNFDAIKAAAPLAVSPPAGAVSLTTFALTSGNSGQDETKAVLDLLEKVGKTNLLSSPRITVLNNEEAKLAVATRQPFVSQTVVQNANSTSTADNVQFVDVGVTLHVKPRISNDDFVEMRIKPEVSSQNQTLELQSVAPGSDTTFTRSVIPVVTTQELETTVQIKSGTTVIIGGLIQDRQEKQSSKVPIIGSIPLLGRAFQSKSHDFVKTELVTFLTPTIIRPTQESPEQEARFFDPEKKMLPFEVFGDYPYRTTYADPRRFAETGETPYWERPKGLKGFLYPLTGGERNDTQNAGQ